MADEQEDTGAPETPETTKDTGPSFPPGLAAAIIGTLGGSRRIGTQETGDGTLLERAVQVAEERTRAEFEQVDVEHGLQDVPIIRNPEGEVLVMPPADFDAYRSQPLYISGTAQLGSLDSLIDYTNRHKDSDSVVFADDDRKAPSITAVLDYHKQGGPADGGQRFGRHQAKFGLPLSDQWKAWASLNGQAITMPNFARFLEDQIVDVMPVGMIELSASQEKFVEALGGRSKIADPARLLELATGLRIYENSQASQVVNLASGEGEITFTSNHTDAQGGTLNIPKMFVIAIPVFKHGDLYQIVVRLRYRKQGEITFVYEMWRDDLVFDHAFDEAADKVKAATSLPVFRGTRGDS